MSDSEQTTKTSFFETFSSGATILGFIVDFIAIVAIITSLSIDADVPSFINPMFAIWILVLATFSYLGYLHSYWLKNKDKYSKSFSGFLGEDLALNFKSPKHIFPFVLIIATFFLISGTASLGSTDDAVTRIFGALTMMGFVFLFIGTLFLFMAKSMDQSGKRVIDDFKREVDGNWEYWDKLVGEELDDNYWLRSYHFDDIAIVNNLSREQIDYILAKYSSLHRKEAKYETLFKIIKNEDGEEKLEGQGKVLKNIEKMKETPFHV